MAEKVVWDDAHVKKIIEIFKEVVNDGNRPLGVISLRMVGKMLWRNLKQEQGRNMQSSNTRTNWMQSKQSMFFMELTNEATGLGWDDAEKTVH